MRDILESHDQLTLFEPDESLINLSFTNLYREEPVVWLIGEYVAYIEHEVILGNRRVGRADFLGHLTAKKLEYRFMMLPDIGFIPGIDQSGIG